MITRSTLIVKKEILYLVPFGQLSWLAGVEFVNRKNSAQANKVLDDCERLLVNKSIKIWVYPEGTRSYGKGMLQFKRGAFKIAINAQAPVVPIVISPYYFMDYKQKSMKSGKLTFFEFLHCLWLITITLRTWNHFRTGPNTNERLEHGSMRRVRRKCEKSHGRRIRKTGPRTYKNATRQWMAKR